ncbi:hypothetical protein AEL96_03270, partial [Lactobacillus crispatus]|uniref:hypothetical protein n=1 Tax=Lactobacillus crispatus TaxID=47770 RepID=UPI00076D499B
NAKPKNQIWIVAYLSCQTKKINRHEKLLKLKFKQKMKPNFLFCWTLRRKSPKSVLLLGLSSN